MWPREGPPPVVAYDVFCQRYSWDWWTLMEQPVDFVEELGQVIRAEVDHQQAQAHERDRHEPGSRPFPAGPVNRPVLPESPRTPEETWRLAQAAGLPLPGEES